MSTTFSEPFIPEKFPMLIAGDFGTFFTDPTSPVFFINTSFEIDDIKHLKPVREILDVSEVDFDELVQRDLDDFRIKQDIVNYLVDNMGYKFFPPIVVALTQPADHKQSIKEFYPQIKARVIDGKKFEIEFDNAFSITWHINGDNNLHSLPTALRWKPEKTHLMAVDGQHRLVALQAIRGLLTAENLKLFYKSVLKYKDELDNIKVPVTILIFPNCIKSIDPSDLALLQKYFGKINWSPTSRMPVKQVLRDIFVDVNKSAKQPSKARTILLDEKDLSAVFARKVFSSIKDDNPRIYSALLEYNSTPNKETQIEKGRAIITTIGIVYNVCQYLFRDTKPPGLDDGTNFRTRLDILNFPDFPNSEEFPKENIKSTDFSLEQRRTAESIFKEKWLHVFKALYIDLTPFKILTTRMEQEYQKYEVLLEKTSLSLEDNEIYKILFGSIEDRFILENNAKLKSSIESVLKLKKLKEIESGIRSSVANYDLFYSLMFQLGFFEAVSSLIENGVFENNYYVTNNELNNIVTALNLFITDNPLLSIFDYNNPINALLFGGKADPNNTEQVASLILLILLNYKKTTQNVFLKNTKIDEQLRLQLSQSNLAAVKLKMEKSLEKEFNSTTENKYKLSEIQLKKEQDDVSWKVMENDFQAERTRYVIENLIQQEGQLKKILGIEE